MDAGGAKCGDAAAAAGEAGSDLYAVLGLKKECSDAELKVAYRKLAMRQESFEELQQLFVDMFQSDLDSGFCNGSSKGHQVNGQAQSRASSSSPSSSPSPPPPTIVTEAEVPSCNGFNKRGSSAMDSWKPPRPVVDAGVGQSQAGFCFEMSDAKQAPKTRGPNTSRRRNGRKQKLSSKHDVSSEDDTAASQHQQHVAV
ncbi:unnamed protein product [Urochloa humidicola]